jgi:glycosyltransferase involved in cell wall biosynthesis
VITVVIPAHNAESTISQTLESVFAQTLDDYEVIVVDDASTDDTITKVNAFLSAHHQANDRAVRIITLEQNRGPAAARNRGIEAAKSEWIAFLDADDAWLPHRLSKQMALLSQRPDVDMLCGKAVSFDWNAPDDMQIDSNAIETDLVRESFAVANPVATSTVICRRAALKNVGGFDESFRGPEDYDLWMRLACEFRMVKQDIPMVRYRERNGSLSMDDRTFLPQVAQVLEKAYKCGGPLADCGRKKKALAYQFLSAAWMAANRGASVRSVRLFLHSLRLWPFSFAPDVSLPWGRARLLLFMLRSIWRGEGARKECEPSERALHPDQT